MVKIIYIRIAVFALMLVFSIGCGIYGYSAGKRVSELDREGRVLREELANGSDRIERIESEYRRVARENEKLRREISEGLVIIYDGASNLEKRLQDITESGRGLSSEMRAYIP